MYLLVNLGMARTRIPLRTRPLNSLYQFIFKEFPDTRALLTNGRKDLHLTYLFRLYLSLWG